MATTSTVGLRLWCLVLPKDRVSHVMVVAKLVTFAATVPLTGVVVATPEEVILDVDRC